MYAKMTKADPQYWRTGNIFRDAHGKICIVAKVGGGYVHWVSFNSQNISGTTRLVSYTEKANCYDSFTGDLCDDPDCKDCKGTGHYNRVVKGMEEATLLASSAMELINDKIRKVFEDGF